MSGGGDVAPGRGLEAALARERRQHRAFDRSLADLLERGQPHLRAPQRSGRWFTARRGRLTASHFGAAAGLCNVASPRDLHRHLEAALCDDVAYDSDAGEAGGPDADWDDVAHENENLSRGVRLEPLARDAYSASLCSDVEETGLWVCTEPSWLGASPDGLVGDDGLIEIKAPRVLRADAGVARGAPVEYVHPRVLAQIQGQLFVTGRAWCDLVEAVELDGGKAVSIRVTRVPFDEAYWAWLRSRLEDFWGGLVAGIEPDPCAPRAQPPRVAGMRRVGTFSHRLPA